MFVQGMCWRAVSCNVTGYRRLHMGVTKTHKLIDRTLSLYYFGKARSLGRRTGGIRQLATRRGEISSYTNTSHSNVLEDMHFAGAASRLRLECAAFTRSVYFEHYTDPEQLPGATLAREGSNADQPGTMRHGSWCADGKWLFWGRETEV